MRLTRFVDMCMAGAVLLMACEKENNYNDTIIAEPDNYPTEDAL